MADQALERLNLQAVVKTHGRRSSNIRDWGQELLDILKSFDFSGVDRRCKNSLIDDAQGFFGPFLRSILEQEPLTAHIRNRSAEAVIRELLKQAEDKGKAGDVAQYLVGAKLEIRLGIELPVVAANKRDRRSPTDPEGRLGDFEIAEAVIELAVGLPDGKHISQIADALEEADEVWLITRKDRVLTWENELAKTLEAGELKRVVITSVESFVGQNITELGKFSSNDKAEQLGALFKRYNMRWISKVGTPGIRIELKP